MKFYSVFDSKQLYDLAKEHRPAFEALGCIATHLNQRFEKMQDPILALILAVASGEPLLFKGPPGTAKSWLVRAFCRCIGIDPGQSGQARPDDEAVTDYFEYLLTPFTEPGELFGYFNIARAVEDKKLVRDTQGMMQHAKVVYLDEVFKGSSAILNSLLAFMNERVFHDRGKRVDVELRCLFGATNEVPHTAALRAVYDRFSLRCEIQNIEATPTALHDLLNKGWRETYSASDYETYPDLLEGLDAFRKDADQWLTRNNPLASESDAFLSKLAACINMIRHHGLSEMSNRRVIKFLRIMMIHSIYQYVNDERLGETFDKQGIIQLTDKELGLWRFVVDRRDELAEEHLRQWG